MAKKKEEQEEENLEEISNDELLKSAYKLLHSLNPLATMIKNSQSNIENYDSTGCYLLDALLSGRIKDGGFPEGRVSTLAAESSTGKTYIALAVAAIAQKKGKVVVLFDSEGAIDAKMCSNLGLDVDKVLYFPVKSIEDCDVACNQLLNQIAQNKQFGKYFFVIDSLGNMTSNIEWTKVAKGDMTANMGRNAQALGGFIQKITPQATNTRTTIICTNHIYDNPGQLYPTLEKNQRGGKNTTYMPSVVVQLTKRWVKEDDATIKTDESSAVGSKDVVGIAISALLIKSRVCKPMLTGSLFLSWETGLSKYYGLLDLAIDFGVVTNKMGKIYKGEEFLGNRKTLAFDSEAIEKLIPEIQEHIDKEWTYKVNF